MMNSDKNTTPYSGDTENNKASGSTGVRGGRGSAGVPTEIRESISDAHKEAVRIDHDLAKFKNDKDALLFTVADLRVKEKQAVEKGLPGETEAIRKEIVEAQERIDKINGVLHETNIPEDHKKIQKIVSEWYGGKRDWRNGNDRFQKAEKTLESFPNDRRAQGEANRARAEMKLVNDQLADIAKQAEGVIKSVPDGTTEGGGISFTHEQALLEREALAKRHKESLLKEVAPEVSVEEKIVQNKTKEEVAQKIETPEQEPVFEVQEQETPIIFQNVLEKMPEVKFLPDPETDDDLLPLVTEHAETTVSTPRASRQVLGLSASIKKIFNFFSSITAKSKVRPKDTVTKTPELVAEKEEPVPQIMSEGAPEEIISPDEFLEKPLFTEFETTEKPSFNMVEEKAVQEEEPVAVETEPVLEELAPVISLQQEILPEKTEEATKEEYVPPMPQEITPGNTTEFTQLEAQAEEVLRNDMDQIFGEKNGPFGIFGHTNGMESKNWKDPQLGFSVKTVGDVLRAIPQAPLAEMEMSFGIEDNDLVENMKKYLANVGQVSGLDIEANSGSSLADYIRRAAIAKLSK